MSRLLEKIKDKRAVDSVDSWKTSSGAASQSTNAVDLLWISKEANPTTGPNPQSPQSLWTRKPAPDIDIHESTNPQRVTNEIQQQEPPISDPKSQLIELAMQVGIYEHALVLEEKEVAALVPPSDWNDAALCTPEELQAWAVCLALRAVRYRGKVPAGWTRVSICKRCGPVWSDHGLDSLSCGWCEMRKAGKWFPRP